MKDLKDVDIVFVVGGWNIDFIIIGRIIQKGLVSSGRVGILDATIDDVPGSLHTFTGIISSHRGNILNIVHDRFAGNLPIGNIRVVFVIEVRKGTDTP